MAGLGVIVVSGVAIGLTGSESPSADVEAKKVVVADSPKSPGLDIVHETRWPDGEADIIEKAEPREEPAEEEPDADTTPPAFQILHPVDGQVFESKEVVFEGTAEPGARVFAGEYEADVNDTGGWRIVLFLSPGTNHAVLKAKDAAGNLTEDSVTVVYERGEEPKEEPKEEQPKDKEVDGVWEFVAYQAYGECSENPPYDVFYGKGKPGSVIRVVSEYGDGEAVVGDHGEWELRVYFEGSPIGQGILVKVKDQFDHQQTFEFTHTA
ncbi:MAG TPA: hypothetical protein VIH32_01495 [Acidimicrobiia bacterium]